MTPKERKAAYDLARRLANPEAKRAAGRRYYLANRQKVIARNSANQAARREEVTEYYRRWREANPDRVAAIRRNWHLANPDANRIKTQNYRNRKAGGSLTRQEWEDIKDAHGHRCFYCGRPGEPLEVEHKVPLSRGGAHDSTNVVPSCPEDNRRKGAMTADEYLHRLFLNPLKGERS